MPRFKEIEHTADRAFRVTGRDMASLLENAARQCMRWMSPRVHSKHRRCGRFKSKELIGSRCW
ncbi:MAG: hypothetical protein DMG82_01740 [Acidobacteria bacterium]|nr:MAG: hypothetical protein DMG82_01740 [Acidobacteriota bacterium]PYX44953.1 MAG: hypothetical protein DMG83_11670 [Acidobacteriota bacterium]